MKHPMINGVEPLLLVRSGHTNSCRICTPQTTRHRKKAAPHLFRKDTSTPPVAAAACCSRERTCAGVSGTQPLFLKGSSNTGKQHGMAAADGSPVVATAAACRQAAAQAAHAAAAARLQTGKQAPALLCRQDREQHCMYVCVCTVLREAATVHDSPPCQSPCRS